MGRGGWECKNEEKGDSGVGKRDRGRGEERGEHVVGKKARGGEERRGGRGGEGGRRPGYWLVEIMEE